MRTLLQPVGHQPEPEPATQQAASEPAGHQPLALATTLVVQLEECATPTGRSDPTLQGTIPDIDMEDIASLEQWVARGLQDMATPTIGSRGTTIPGSRSTPTSVRQDMQRKVEERTKRRAEEPTRKSKSSSEEEEYEDPVSSSSKEDE